MAGETPSDAPGAILSAQQHSPATQGPQSAPGTPAALGQYGSEHGDVQKDSTANGSPSEAAVEGPTFDDSADEATRLAALATGMRNQDDLERDIGRQADALLLVQANERDNKRLEKTLADKARLDGQIHRLQKKLDGFGNSATKNKIRAEIAHYEADVTRLNTDLAQIKKRMEEREQGGEAGEGETLLDEKGNRRLPGESQRDFLIRTGKITPFSRMGRQLLASDSLADVMLDAEVQSGDEDGELLPSTNKAERSHRDLMLPGFADVDAEPVNEPADGEFPEDRPTKRRKLQSRKQPEEDFDDDQPSEGEDSDEFVLDMNDKDLAAIGESADDEEPEDEDVAGDFPLASSGNKRTKRGKTTARKPAQTADDDEDLAGIDDGNESVYQARLQGWIKNRSAARRKAKARMSESEEDKDEATSEDDTPEWHLPLPNRPDAEFEGGFKVPGDIYPSLFDYQKTGVQWLSELYSQQAGGIIGDEMGLGKTIQVISMLAGLHYSNKLTKPIIVVTPATVMKQWVNEFHRWWPPLRVSILHTSGSGMLDVKKEARIEDDLEVRDFSSTTNKKLSKSEKAAKRVVDKVQQDGHVLVTTYSGLQTYADFLIPMDWEYAVLDEGHKIRNPNTAITIHCKELRTHNRIILSGTPMQNNLTELWSLFDFVFPMRLGTLVNFRQQFEFPIKQGGYANASNLQVETAMKCAETLKDAISPYLLQRFKIDVASDLPKKSEHVLFCNLTKPQREAYEIFLGSDEMRSILNGKRQALYGIDILRKICNHPDLTEHKTLPHKAGYNYGTGLKSGKMQVVKALLEIWRKNGHKTLLFAQHRIMLDILQKFIQGLGGFNFLRMDGNTSIKDRQTLVDRFNKDPDLHVFLLTTKVGGLGVNLTGADRVIIYDPDWNPSTDVQARERAWRLGQKKEVDIYRLMTAGTIEEKIYHRQIFKQFLANKILRDPKQRQSFQLSDLHDLFTLGIEGEDGQTETGSIFKGAEVKLTGARKADAAADRTKNGKDAAAGATDGESSKQAQLEEVARITGLHRQEEFQSSADEAQSPTDAADSDSHSKDRVLAGIFSRSGVTSALSHDDIMSGGAGQKRKITADPAIIAREAKRVAARAADELRRAGEIARSLPAGSVSWTGVHGDAGRPDGRPPPAPARGALGARARGGARGRGNSASTSGSGSSAVLTNLSSRQGRGEPSSSSLAASTATSSRTITPQPAPTPEHQPEGMEFFNLILDYLKAHGGKVHTQMLIDHFNRFCTTQERTMQFKEMLKTMAVLEKPPETAASVVRARSRARSGGIGRGGGRAKWALRPEYLRPVGGESDASGAASSTASGRAPGTTFRSVSGAASGAASGASSGVASRAVPGTPSRTPSRTPSTAASGTPSRAVSVTPSRAPPMTPSRTASRAPSRTPSRRPSKTS